MADWHVSESDREEDEAYPSEQDDVPVDPSRLFGLLQTIKRERTLQLECDRVLKADRSHRKRKRRKKLKRIANDEIDISSETEIKSTHTTTTVSTPSDCRDTRRPDLSVFDYEHEDFMLLPLKTSKTRKYSANFRKVAKLDDIEAGLKKEEEVRWKEKNNADAHSIPPSILATPPATESCTGSPHNYKTFVSNEITNGYSKTNGITKSTEEKNCIKFELGFEENNDESSTFDLDSSFSTHEILSHIEHFLDDEI